MFLTIETDAFENGVKYEMLVARKLSRRVYQHLYKIGRTLPVRIGDVVINYKVYKAFHKKLKGFVVEEQITENGLELKYWKPNSDICGVLQLQNLAPYFDGFRRIPVAVYKDKGGASDAS